MVTVFSIVHLKATFECAGPHRSKRNTRNPSNLQRSVCTPTSLPLRSTGVIFTRTSVFRLTRSKNIKTTQGLSLSFPTAPRQRVSSRVTAPVPRAGTPPGLRAPGSAPLQGCVEAEAPNPTAEHRAELGPRGQQKTALSPPQLCPLHSAREKRREAAAGRPAGAARHRQPRFQSDVNAKRPARVGKGREAAEHLKAPNLSTKQEKALVNSSISPAPKRPTERFFQHLAENKD